MVFQDYVLYPHLTVRENAVLAFQTGKALAARRLDAVQRIAPRLGLEDCLEKPPGRLSGGERQRAALLKTLVSEARLWLMDEPLANLDETRRLDIRSLLLAEQRKGKPTVLYVTHDIADALALADEIVVLEDGLILQTGVPEDLLSAPSSLYVDRALHSPPPNEFNATISRNGTGATTVAFERPGAASLANRSSTGESSDLAAVITVLCDDIFVLAAREEQLGAFDTQVEVCVIERGSRRVLVEGESPYGRVRFWSNPEDCVGVGDRIRVSADDKRLRAYDHATRRALGLVRTDI